VQRIHLYLLSFTLLRTLFLFSFRVCIQCSWLQELGHTFSYNNVHPQGPGVQRASILLPLSKLCSLKGGVIPKPSQFQCTEWRTYGNWNLIHIVQRTGDPPTRSVNHQFKCHAGEDTESWNFESRWLIIGYISNRWYGPSTVSLQVLSTKMQKTANYFKTAEGNKRTKTGMTIVCTVSNSTKTAKTIYIFSITAPTNSLRTTRKTHWT